MALAEAFSQIGTWLDIVLTWSKNHYIWAFLLLLFFFYLWRKYIIYGGAKNDKISI